MRDRLADTIKMLLVKTDLNYSEIASSLYCSVGYVHDVAKKCNLARQSKKSKIIELLKSNPDMSYADIAAKVGYTAKNVCSIANQNGLARRTHKYNDKYMQVLDYLQNQEYKTIAQAARNLGLPYAYVRSIAKENKII